VIDRPSALAYLFERNHARIAELAEAREGATFHVRGVGDGSPGAVRRERAADLAGACLPHAEGMKPGWRSAWPMSDVAQP
jgi:hypothetical protein